MAPDYLLGDCHTHLDKYPPAEVPDILERAGEAGVGFVVCAGTTVESSQACVQMSQQYAPLYAGVGIHPMEAHQPVDEDVYANLERLARDNPKVVCVSEIGLDFLPESPDRAVQDQVFREQIRLALQLELPIIFHSRESHPEVMRVLREEGADVVGGVMHYFQGDEPTARQAIDHGFFISPGPAAAPAPRTTGSRQGHPLGAHCSGDRCGAPALQKIPEQLDRAPSYRSRGPTAGRTQGP